MFLYAKLLHKLWIPIRRRRFKCILTEPVYNTFISEFYQSFLIRRDSWVYSSGQQHSLHPNDEESWEQRGKLDLEGSAVHLNILLNKTLLCRLFSDCTAFVFTSWSLDLTETAEFVIKSNASIRFFFSLVFCLWTTSSFLCNSRSYRISCKRKPRLGSAQSLRSTK